MSTAFVSAVAFAGSVWAIDAKYDQGPEIKLAKLQLAQIYTQQNASFKSNVTLIQRHIIKELEEVVIYLEVKPQKTMDEKRRLLRARKEIKAAESLINDLK